MVSRAIAERWPELPYAAWKDTRDKLKARHAAFVDASCRQGPARADAVAQSLMARRALRHRARADHVADAVARRQLSGRF